MISNQEDTGALGSRTCCTGEANSCCDETNQHIDNDEKPEHGHVKSEKDKTLNTSPYDENAPKAKDHAAPKLHATAARSSKTISLEEAIEMQLVQETTSLFVIVVGGVLLSAVLQWAERRPDPVR